MHNPHFYIGAVITGDYTFFSPRILTLRKTGKGFFIAGGGNGKLCGAP